MYHLSHSYQEEDYNFELPDKRLVPFKYEI